MAKKAPKKAIFIVKMRENLGNISEACKAVGISRQTYYRWLEEDADFKRDVENIGEELLDNAERKLQEKIDMGDTSSLIFYLKTKGKKRDYVERIENKVSGDKENPLFVPKDIADKL